MSLLSGPNRIDDSAFPNQGDWGPFEPSAHPGTLYTFQRLNSDFAKYTLYQATSLDGTSWAAFGTSYTFNLTSQPNYNTDSSVLTVVGTVSGAVTILAFDLNAGTSVSINASSLTGIVAGNSSAVTRADGTIALVWQHTGTLEIWYTPYSGGSFGSSVDLGFTGTPYDIISAANVTYLFYAATGGAGRRLQVINADGSLGANVLITATFAVPPNFGPYMAIAGGSIFIAFTSGVYRSPLSSPAFVQSTTLSSASSNLATDGTDVYLVYVDPVVQDERNRSINDPVRVSKYLGSDTWTDPAPVAAQLDNGVKPQFYTNDFSHRWSTHLLSDGTFGMGVDFLDPSAACTAYYAHFSLTTVPLAFACNNPYTGVVNVFYDHVLQVTGGYPIYSVSVIAGSLPPGLSLGILTAYSWVSISGTPTLAGTYSFTLQVTDSLSNTATVVCSITINPVIAIDCGQIATVTGVVGSSYDFFLSSAYGGADVLTFTLISGSLPTGLTMDSTSGEISGTPTAAGTFPFTVQVADTHGHTSQIGCAIVVGGVAVTCGTLADGTVGTPYSGTLSISGGTAPYTLALTSGSLPAGLTLNTSTGAITGTPTATGTYTFTVEVISS